jgi:hypothetical protein
MFQVSTALLLRILIFWNVALCGGLEEPDVSKYRSTFKFSSTEPRKLSILVYCVRTQKIRKKNTDKFIKT